MLVLVGVVGGGGVHAAAFCFTAVAAFRIAFGLLSTVSAAPRSDKSKLDTNSRNGFAQLRLICSLALPSRSAASAMFSIINATCFTLFAIMLVRSRGFHRCVERQQGDMKVVNAQAFGVI
jgi:hypothetical protein